MILSMHVLGNKDKGAFISYNFFIKEGKSKRKKKDKNTKKGKWKYVFGKRIPPLLVFASIKGLEFALSLQIFLKILRTHDWISVVNVVVSSRNSISPFIGTVRTIKEKQKCENSFLKK